ILAWQVLPPWGGVGSDEDQTQLRGHALRPSLHREGFLCAGESREEGNDGASLAGQRLRRAVKRKAHGAIAVLGLMAVDTLNSLKAAVFCHFFYGHVIILSGSSVGGSLAIRLGLQ